MFAADDSKAIVFRGVFVEDSRRRVRRTVVNADAFPVQKRLCADGIQAFAQIRRNVVDGYDYGDCGGGVHVAESSEIEEEWQAGFYATDFVGLFHG